jgi:hypothetical protein
MRSKSHLFCTRNLALLALLAFIAGPVVGQLASDGEWPMAARDPANSRFSPLDQITTGNADRLRVAFTFPLGVERGQEAAPIVVGDTMYIVTPFPNYLYAIDLGKPEARLKWKFDPKADAGSQGVACCDVVNRGAAYADGRLFYNTLDAHTIAVDRGQRSRALAHQARRSRSRRDDDDGAAGRARQGAGRQQRRRTRGARLADRARCGDGRSSGAPGAPAPTAMC